MSSLDNRTLFKTLDGGHRSPYQHHRWPTPNGRPAEWVTSTGRLEACVNGVHVCRGRQVLGWLREEVWLVEVDGDILEAPDKLVCRRARLVERLPWDQRMMVAFAVDCADRVLHLFEEQQPEDTRPRAVLDAATAWVVNPTEKAAASASAYAASYAASYASAAAYAYASAYAASYAASYASAAAYAYASAYASASASASAYAASYAASYASAAADAHRAERDWQYQRLCRWLTGELQLP